MLNLCQIEQNVCISALYCVGGNKNKNKIYLLAYVGGEKKIKIKIDKIIHNSYRNGNFFTNLQIIMTTPTVLLLLVHFSGMYRIKKLKKLRCLLFFLVELISAHQRALHPYRV